MPSYIVKTGKDEDFYVMWSTVVDSPFYWGTAEDFEDEDPERLERANKYGTSSYNGFYNWDDEDFYVRELGTEHKDYSLPRKNLKAFLDRMSEDLNEDSSTKPEQEQKALDEFCTEWVSED